MGYHNERPDLYERLDSVHMSDFRRRAAAASLQSAEANADLIFAAANAFRRAMAGLARVFRTSGQGIG
jgi:hypothetical protein